jgi:hypothetical protein
MDPPGDQQLFGTDELPEEPTAFVSDWAAGSISK